MRKTKTANMGVALVVMVLGSLSYWVISGGQNGSSGETVNGFDGREPHYHRVAATTVQRQQSYSVNRRFSGRVSARQHADIGFEQGGKLAEVLVDEGARIAKGEVLAVLDIELLRIEQQELNAQLKETRARLQLTENNLKRQRSLKASGYTSEQRLDELQTERAALLASMARLDASLESVASRIRKATLLAPFDGVVTRRYVDQGAVVGAGLGVIRLQQEGGMEVHVGVPVRTLENLSPGAKLSVLANGQRYAASLLTAGADVHPVTRTVNLRLSLERDADLINGDLASVEIAESVSEPGFWLPITAVTDGVRGLWVVYQLEPTSQRDRYKLVTSNVTVLHAEPQRVYVSGSLDHGDQVVASGLLKVVPGQLVRTELDVRLMPSALLKSGQSPAAEKPSGLGSH